MSETRIDKVTFDYDFNPEEGLSELQVPGVSDLSLDFPPGSCTLVTGPSGSGKSTLLKLLNGLIPELFQGKLDGQVLLEGFDTKTTDIQLLGRHCGTVFQNPRSQFFTARVLEELAFAGENAGDDPEVIKAQIARALEIWGITDFIDRKLNQLSAGELQLVACAAALCGPQRTVLFDEPTSNLSPQAIEVFSEILNGLKKDGWTIVVAEHRLYPLRDAADQVVVLHDGKVVLRQSGAEFFASSPKRRQELGLRTLVRPQANTSEASVPEQNGGIEVEELRFSYGKKIVLDLDRLCVPNGMVTALTGPNGAGKTTLARVLIGLESPEKGTVIRFNGAQCGHHQRTKRSVLVMQDVNRQLFGETVASEVGLGNRGVTEEQTKQTLEKLGLIGLEDRHPMTLSGGQKQRLVIANAAVSDSELYVFDEPTSGVDYQHMLSISALLKDLAAKGKAVLVITHDAEFISEVADLELQLSPWRADSPRQLRQKEVIHKEIASSEERR